MKDEKGNYLLESDKTTAPFILHRSSFILSEQALQHILEALFPGSGNDAEAAAEAVEAAGFDWVSPGVVGDLDGALGYPAAVLVRDPDGHGVLLRQD